MSLWVSVLGICLAGLSAAATAQVSPRNHVQQAQRAGSSAKVVSKTHPPTGTQTKPSSFAPHPTKRRVFGAPIQGPILSNVQPPKKHAPK